MDEKLLEALRPFAKMVAEELVKIMPTEEPRQKETSEQYKGIDGIATIFQCSRSKAQRLKDSGVLDSAITRLGSRAFIIDKAKAIAAVNNQTNKVLRYC